MAYAFNPFTGNFDITGNVTVTGGLTYQGVWNASTNTPAIPAAAPANKNQYYIVSVKGTTTVDGISAWDVGDWIISNGVAWQKLVGADAGINSVGAGLGLSAAGVLSLGDGSGVTYDSTNRSLTLTGATVTTSKPVLDLSQEWGAAGVTFTGLKFNASGSSNTNSAAGSRIADYQVGGVTKAYLDKTGKTWTTSLEIGTFGPISAVSNNILNFYNNQFSFDANGGVAALILTSAGTFGFSSGVAGAAASMDVRLTRGGPATLQLGAADVASGAVAQTLQVQSNTGAQDGPNFTIKGSTSGAANVGGSIILQTARAGTYYNALSLGTTNSPGPSATVGANGKLLVGASFLLDDFLGRFLVYSGGHIAFASGLLSINSTTYDLALWRDAAGILALKNSTSPQIFRVYSTTTGPNYGYIAAGTTDAGVATADTLFIGTGGAGGAMTTLSLQTASATRLSINSATFSVFVNQEVANNKTLGFAGSTTMFATANGSLRITNYAGSDFGLLMLGGTTSSFPALKRSSATLAVRLADDSADAALSCGNTTGGGTALNVTGTGGASLMSVTNTTSGDLFSVVNASAATVFKVTDTGATTTAGAIDSGGTVTVRNAGGACVITTNGSNYFLAGGMSSAVGQMRAPAAGSFGFSSTSDPSAAADTLIYRDAANTLALRNSTNPQTFNWYGSYTSGAVYKRGALSFKTYSAADYVTLTAEADTGNIGIVLQPLGTGAIMAQVPDGGTGGGNARGTYAVDLQMTRGGQTQVASGSCAFIGGGQFNTASGNFSAVLGWANTASGLYSAALGGHAGTASGSWSVVLGGENSVASSSHGLATGYYASATRWGQQSSSAGSFASTAGDSQRVQFNLRCKTTTNAAVEMALDGGTTYLTIISGKVMSGIINVHGVKSDGSAVAHYVRQFSIKNVGGTTTLVALQTIGTDTAAGTSLAVTANDTSDYLSIQPTGVTSETWRWTAYVDAVETAYGA